MKKGLDIKKKIAIIIGVLLVAAAIGGGIYCYLTKDKGSLGDTGTDALPQSIEDVDLSKYPYVRDTDYKNPFKYMDVYSYPFQKSEDYYKKNKDMVKGTDTLSEFAKQTIESIYNTNYTDIASSREKYEEKFKKLLNNEGGFFLMAGPGADENIFTANEAIEAIETYYIENSASTTATFETNASLVYEDGYLYCRGVLELETFTDGESTKKAIPVDAIFYQDMSTASFIYCGMVNIEGYEEFEIG